MTCSLLRRPLSVAVVVGILAILAPLGAVLAQTETNRIDAATRESVIDATAKALDTTYVEVEAGRTIGDLLRRRLAEGAYDRLDNPAQFAATVTTDMRRQNGDLHLSLQDSPPGATQAGGGGPDNPAARNFGLGKVEILDGNVGYLEITGFMGAPGAQDACHSHRAHSPFQIAVLLRAKPSFVVVSSDEGATWSTPRELPAALTGDRHVARYGPDGRHVRRDELRPLGGRPAGLRRVGAIQAGRGRSALSPTPPGVNKNGPAVNCRAVGDTLAGRPAGAGRRSRART